MQKAHDAAKNDFWHNRPDTSSPITETELNRIETNIDTIDDRVVTFDITKANQSDLLTCVSGISLNTTTGILTITLKNGTTSTLDTGLAKLAINFDYDDDPTSAHYQQIILEMKDGTYKYIDLSALITQYEFVNTSTIVWTIESDGKIKANVPNGSITAEKLQPNYLADVTSQANRATGAVTSTEANRLEAEGFAKGTQNGQPVGADSPYYENNAKFFRDGARAITGNKVDTWNGRDGMVVPLDDDYNIGQITPSSGATEGQVPIVDSNGRFVMGNVAGTYFGETTTQTGTFAANVPGFTSASLKNGVTITIKFNTSLAAGSGTPTLNINNTGAKYIYYTDQLIGNTGYSFASGDFVTFLYKDNHYEILSHIRTPIIGIPNNPANVTSSNDEQSTYKEVLHALGQQIDFKKITPNTKLRKITVSYSNSGRSLNYIYSTSIFNLIGFVGDNGNSSFVNFSRSVVLHGTYGSGIETDQVLIYKNSIDSNKELLSKIYLPSGASTPTYDLTTNDTEICKYAYQIIY